MEKKKIEFPSIFIFSLELIVRFCSVFDFWVNVFLIEKHSVFQVFKWFFQETSQFYLKHCYSLVIKCGIYVYKL